MELAEWGEGGIGQLNFRNFLIKTGGVVAIPKRGVAIALKILNKSELMKVTITGITLHYVILFLNRVKIFESHCLFECRIASALFYLF